MHVERIDLENWLCFAGEQTIELGPQVYGVVALGDDDETRSNWLGKTSLLTSIPFALKGKHDSDNADAWITRGQGRGMVRLQLGDGVVVERSRRRGSSTKLIVRHRGLEAADADAQELLDKLLGIDPMLTWFRQGAMSQYVTQRPGERMESIGAWVGLGPLRAAESSARTRLSLAEQDRGSFESQLAAVRRDLRDAVARWFELGEGEPVPPEDEVDEAFGELVADAEACVARAQGELDAAAERLEAVGRAEREEAARRELASLEARLAGIRLVATLPLRDAVQQADAVLQDKAALSREARNKVTQARQLARGEFGGVCPIDGHACPDCETMNARAAENEVRLREAMEAADKARLEASAAELAKRDAEAALVAAERSNHDREYLAGEVARLRAEVGPGTPDAAAKWVESARQAHGSAAAAFSEARGQLERVRGERDRVRGLMARERELAGKLEAARAICATRRQALLVVGRNGAQKRLAEAVLAQVDDMANDALAAAGIALKVRQTWGHETKEPAEWCDGCGEPYQGRRPKECPRCGMRRGRKWIEQPEVELSRVSGAARDLAGVAIQLAAASWLRASRQAAWSCALIDEAFGQLDAYHRRSLASSIAGLIGGWYGFEQALVVAHERDVIEALPGRILVRGQEGRSIVEVMR